MRGIWIYILLSIGSWSMAQNSYQFGLLPAVNLTQKLPSNIKINFKTESRQGLKKGTFDVPSDFNYEYIQTDFSFVAAQKIAINQSVALGYLMRVKGDQIIHRFIQQFIIKKKYESFRLAHRFSTDQTFEKEKDIKYRLRYRISSFIPTNGQSVDPKELYFKINHEYLNDWQSDDYDLEIRLVPHVGYVFSDTNKLELGLDYRLDKFLKDDSRNRFWVAINWYYGIDLKSGKNQ